MSDFPAIEPARAIHSALTVSEQLQRCADADVSTSSRKLLALASAIIKEQHRLLVEIAPDDLRTAQYTPRHSLPPEAEGE